MTDPDIEALGDPGAWPAATGRLLADLGFSLANSNHPGAPGGTNLLVALRDRPTLRHFDPEIVRVWVSLGGRGRQLELDRRRARPYELPVSWGHVHVIDRLDVENRFLTFGGLLRAADLDTHAAVLALRSPGPIVRWGGHSQGDDPMVGQVGAFFGRIMIPVDFRPGVEGHLASTDPAVLFAAFLRAQHEQLERSRAIREASPAFDAWVEAEAWRVAATSPDAWAAAEPLLAELGLATPA